MCLTNSFYAICHSVLESCVYWTADTLDATVEYGIVFFNEIIKYQANSSEFPQNVNIYIYRANVTVNFVLSHWGKLVWSSSSSQLALQGLLMESVTMNTGVLLHFPEICLGCVFHKTSKSTTFFFMSLSESEELKIHKTSDVTSVTSHTKTFLAVCRVSTDIRVYIVH